MDKDKKLKEPVVFLYGKRDTDILPGVLEKKGGKYYIKAAHLSNLNTKIKKLSMLMDVSRSIMAEMDIDSLLSLIMLRVTQVMDADRSTLFLVDRKTGDLWSRIAQGMSKIHLKMGEGIAGYVAETGETVNIEDAYNDSRFDGDFDKKTGYKTKSILCMAIKNQHGEIIGSIQVLNKLDDSKFTREDEELLAAFCSLAGISLENAWIHEELGKERASLETKVKERTKDLEIAKKKSDDLLLNVLPAEIANELKTKGEVTAKHYDLATVLFTDFIDFTQLAEKMTPDDLVEQLDKCFYYFDEVVDRYNMEKIKTIGDSYLCAGGLPKANTTNPVDAVIVALEIRNIMEQMREIKVSLGEPFWELRIGIHSGPVIAGVVGKKKFIYDIWGDTVNTASRIESSGEAGKINISGHTFELVKDYFECTYRGKVPAKHKGEIDMHFVERIKPEFSDDKEGKIPNGLLRKMI